MEISLEDIIDLKEISVTEYNVTSINSIKDKYPTHRQKSKTVTFAAQYGGSFRTFMDSGFPEEEAKQIEANYHKLYAQSKTWETNLLNNACSTGYVPCAFGLKLRTPLLKQSILGNSKTVNAATGEGRTAANAAQQSFGLLNNRAANAFMEKVWNSEFKYDILPISLIHDAIYLMIRDDLRVLKFVNDNLVEEMSWQELPEIQHDEVKLGAELDVCYQGWHQAITIPNHADEATILATLQKGVKKFE